MGDVTSWNEQQFRMSELHERQAKNRTVFGLDFAPASASADILAVASADGSIAIHSLISCLHQQAAVSPLTGGTDGESRPVRPLLLLSGHKGPAYDVVSLGQEENAWLFSCGDDGHTKGWRWQDILGCTPEDTHGEHLAPTFSFQNPQQRGSYGALLPVPETNALAGDIERRRIFSAAGDGCAYSCDLETQQVDMVFHGHDDYLHCISSRPAQNQLITGSEDGTVRIWDCRTGNCISILDPWNGLKVSPVRSEKSPWISCMSLDTSGNWLVCGSGGRCVTLWNLPVLEAVTRITTLAAPQAVTLTTDQIVIAGALPHISRFTFGGNKLSQIACCTLSAFAVSVHPSGVTAVGGHGGVIDILSDFGSHLCTFRC